MFASRLGILSKTSFASQARVVLCQPPARQHRDQELRAGDAVLKSLIIVKCRCGHIVLAQTDVSVGVDEPVAPESQPTVLVLQLLQGLSVSVVPYGKGCEFQRIIDPIKVGLNPVLVQREASFNCVFEAPLC